MINIIKNGVVQKDRTYKRVCANCDAEFTFQQADLKSDMRDHFYYIYCPVCKYGHCEESMNNFEQYNEQKNELSMNINFKELWEKFKEYLREENRFGKIGEMQSMHEAIDRANFSMDYLRKMEQMEKDIK